MCSWQYRFHKLEHRLLLNALAAQFSGFELQPASRCLGSLRSLKQVSIPGNKKLGSLNMQAPGTHTHTHTHQAMNPKLGCKRFRA